MEAEHSHIEGDSVQGALISKRTAEPDYEDNEKDIKDILLVPSKYLLTFSSTTNKNTISDFIKYQHTQNSNFKLICNAFLFLIFLTQTIVLISARKQLPHNQTVLTMRAVFLFLLAIALIFRRFIQKIQTFVTLVLYTYGIIVCTTHYYFARDAIYGSSFQEIELIEVFFLYLVSTACR